MKLIVNFNKFMSKNKQSFNYNKNFKIDLINIVANSTEKA